MDHHRLARLHYAWVILAVTCLTVVLTAGVTAVPAVLIHPLEVAFGWDRAAIALAVSINVFLYGLAGPFAGRVMLRVGLRRVMLTSLLHLAGGVAASTQVQTLLHLYLLWGVVVGVGTGSTALVLSATVVNRWFTTQRGCDFSHKLANFSGIIWQCPYVVPCCEALHLETFSPIIWQ